MSKLYLIRHGETDSNKGHRFQGSLDMELNGKGMEQARALAQYLQGFELDAIYCSSMLRASMTAAEVAMSKNMAYMPMDLLREVSFGDWEGMEFSEITKRWPKEMDDFLTHPGEWIPPHGETFAQVEQRCQKAFEQIFAEQGHERNIAVISHGGIIRVQLCMLLGMPLNNLWRISVHNASITTINNWRGRLIVEAFNVANYL